jgi:hypothetical protein
MPTPDYTSQAAGYKALLNGQNRNNASADVSANEQFDRDNLLHFLEENFKTNGNGVSIENFRALMHTLIKSVRVQKDDYSKQILVNRAFRILSSSAGRSYFPSPYYGFMYGYWSTFFTGTFSSTTLPSVGASNGNSFPLTPMDCWDLKSSGFVQNSTSTGDIHIWMAYADPDDATNTNMQNLVFIGETTVNCAITDTDYPYSIQHVGKIPQGKKIIMLVRNAGWTSSTETLYISNSLVFSSHNSNYSQT